ncbi:hypothetical protein H257_09301 [Aphanomyces astaci]|uniref:DDE-1 domain-containing protein n=1 Tax=Aphanomyces astaci TaxID=112090 RepID=W4GCQ7_APHAT|nr:hypothetical protein H257_09301 [Aphanomyces astaci]ETV76864.1 hypothetical protein H257_09301 [Aphanomyces astaci]|eukprot:XP_009833776.1 hypothetical protein H257_09301 [Aphanomyces astaci]
MPSCGEEVRGRREGSERRRCIAQGDEASESEELARPKCVLRDMAWGVCYGGRLNPSPAMTQVVLNRGHRRYLQEVLAYDIENPSILILDNFDSHVTEESEKIVVEELGCVLYPLPPNSTPHCHPLYVSWVLLRSTYVTSGF